MTMSPERWERIKEIVAEAIEHNPAGRADYLDRACGDDAALRAEVDSLLEREGHGSVLLSVPDSDRMAGLLHEHHAEANIGRRIGGFAIKGVLGYGGMGVVYRAAQEHPRRDVALKVVTGGIHASPYQQRLFRREVQSLARMNHPGIAALYEAGNDDEGRQFFAMELVEGRLLTDYARDVTAGIDVRLRLFTRVCRAIHYAHQRGVIHRDIKPSNIIVRGDGQPQVLDFGLAKLTEDMDQTGATTSLGKVHGTLSYMSPEQARGGSHDVDIRSDVYSLGIVLFELLTGRRPHELTNVGLTQAVETICHEPAPRAGRINRALLGDLEIILDKALAKDPDRRYQSAEALADDVDRYLARQPIAARRPSAVYQLRKLASRHRVPTALLTILLLAIVGFGAAMTALYRRADHEAKTSQAVTNVLLDALNAANIRSPQSAEYSVRELLFDVDDRVEKQLRGVPAVEVKVRELLSNAFSSLRHPEHDLKQRLAILRIRQQYGMDDDASMGRDFTHLAYAYHSIDQFEPAESMFRQALDLCRRGAGEESYCTASAMSGLADVLGHLGRFDEAERHALKAMDVFSRLGESETEGALLVPIIHGSNLTRAGRTEEAEDVLREVLQRIPSLPHLNHVWMLAGSMSRE